MDERIKEHLKRLHKYQLLLRDTSKISPERFLDDDVRVSSVEFLNKKNKDEL